MVLSMLDEWRINRNWNFTLIGYELHLEKDNVPDSCTKSLS